MPIDLDHLAKVLRTRLPDGSSIESLQVTSNGFSNRTFLLEGSDLVVRLPPEGEPLLAAFGAHDVLAQFRIMAEFRMIDGAPPVPRPVLLEDDTSVLGFPFFVMERVDCDHWGDFSRPDWVNDADPKFRSQISDALVGNYVRLHQLAPLETLGPVRSAREELERWREPVRDILTPPLSEAFAILFANVPENQRATPCHGDAKVANLLWKDGRVAAMVDYEMAFNGDPRWDVAALLQGLRNADGSQPLPSEDEAGFWGRDRILSTWQERTGFHTERLGWFKAADRARYAALLLHGTRLWEERRTADARFGDFPATAERLANVALAHARADAESA